MIPSMLALLLAPAVALAAEADLDHHLAQARLFVKRGWTDDAWGEVQAALGAPGGADSFAAHELAAQLAWARRDAAESARLAWRAAALAPDPAAAEGARAWARRIDETFGVVEVASPHEGMATRLQLEGGPVLFDPEDKAYVADLALALRARGPLPRTASLPAGDWVVNGQPVTIPAGGTAHLVLPMGAVGRKGMAALQVLRLDVAGGLVVPAAGDVAAVAPSPTTQVGLTLPVGGWLVGAVADWTLQGVRSPTHQTRRDAAAPGLGVRVGAEVFTDTPLAIRPAAVLRLARQPGVGLDCAGGTCTAAGRGTVHTDVIDAWAVVPGAELAVDYREAGRTTALGSGVRLGVDLPLGALSSPEAGTPVSGGWAMVTVRMLGALSFAF